MLHVFNNHLQLKINLIKKYHTPSNDAANCVVSGSPVLCSWLHNSKQLSY